MSNSRSVTARAVTCVLLALSLAMVGCSSSPSQTPMPQTNAPASQSATKTVNTTTAPTTMTEGGIYVAGSGAYGIVAWAIFFYTSTQVDVVGINSGGQTVWSENFFLNAQGAVTILTHSASGQGTYVATGLTNGATTPSDIAFSNAASHDFTEAYLPGHQGPISDVARSAIGTYEARSNVSLRPMDLASCYSEAQASAGSSAEILADEEATYPNSQDAAATLSAAFLLHAHNVIGLIQACQSYIPGGYIGHTWCYQPAGSTTATCVSAPDIGLDAGTGGFVPLGDGSCSISITTETVNCVIKI